MPAYAPGLSQVVIRLPQCRHSRRRMIGPPQVGRAWTTRKRRQPHQRQARPFRSACSGQAHLNGKREESREQTAERGRVVSGAGVVQKQATSFHLFACSTARTLQ